MSRFPLLKYSTKSILIYFVFTSGLKSRTLSDHADFFPYDHDSCLLERENESHFYICSEDQVYLDLNYFYHQELNDTSEIERTFRHCSDIKELTFPKLRPKSFSDENLFDSVSRMQKLRYVDLSFNPICSLNDLPENLFGNLKKLRVVNLSACQDMSEDIKNGTLWKNYLMKEISSNLVFIFPFNETSYLIKHNRDKKQDESAKLLTDASSYGKADQQPPSDSIYYQMGLIIFVAYYVH